MQNDLGRFVGRHSPKADIWSLGMVLYYLCYSHTPFGPLEDLDAIREQIIEYEW
jgi:serine/threonine protein kinase